MVESWAFWKGLNAGYVILEELGVDGRGRAPLPSFLKALCDTFDARSPFDMCSFWKEKAWFNLWT